MTDAMAFAALISLLNTIISIFTPSNRGRNVFSNEMLKNCSAFF